MSVCSYFLWKLVSVTQNPLKNDRYMKNWKEFFVCVQYPYTLAPFIKSWSSSFYHELQTTEHYRIQSAPVQNLHLEMLHKLPPFLFPLLIMYIKLPWLGVEKHDPVVITTTAESQQTIPKQSKGWQIPEQTQGPCCQFTQNVTHSIMNEVIAFRDSWMQSKN